MFTLAAYLTSQQTVIDRFLDSRLPGEDAPPGVLSKAMRYSIFSGGKRFRPVLCLAVAQAVDPGSGEAALLPACAVELLHTYSLIHDDLPALDNDDERRGRPTSHKVFGEANAILAGDGLLTLAFEWMAGAKPSLPYTASQLCIELARAGGPAGIVGGQVEDMAAQGHATTEEQMIHIHTLKTVSLLRAAVRIGAMSAGACAPVLTALTRFGEELGMAYQIIDDIDDFQTAGAGSSDVRLQKLTAVTVYGLEESRKKARQCIERAGSYIESADLDEEGRKVLQAIIQSIVPV